MEMDFLTQLNRSLPKNFEFYHLGHVSLGSESKFDIPENFQSLSFEIYSMNKNKKLLSFLIIDPTLQTDVYAEIGNTILSKAATKLSHFNGSDEVLTSPPRTISSSRVKVILKDSKKVNYRQYIHKNGNHEIKAILATIEIFDRKKYYV